MMKLSKFEKLAMFKQNLKVLKEYDQIDIKKEAGSL